MFSISCYLLFNNWPTFNLHSVVSQRTSRSIGLWKCIGSGNRWNSIIKSPYYLSVDTILYSHGLGPERRTDGRLLYASRWLKETKRQRNCKLSWTYKTKRVGFNLGAILLAGGCSGDTRTSLVLISGRLASGLVTFHKPRRSANFRTVYLWFLFCFHLENRISLVRNKTRTADIPYLTFCALREVSQIPWKCTNA